MARSPHAIENEGIVMETKVVVVTGGASGIGRAAVLRFSEEGYSARDPRPGRRSRCRHLASLPRDESRSKAASSRRT